MQNIAGCYQQAFENQKFVDNIQQFFAFTPFPPIIWIFGEGDVMWLNTYLTLFTH